MTSPPTPSQAELSDIDMSRGAPAAPFEGLTWLAEDARSLDWNGPTEREFSEFGAEGLDRPVLESFERAVRKHGDRIAISDSNSRLTYAALWDGVCGLAQAIAARTKEGELVGVLLPTSPMIPLAMLASLAAGRPFVVLDPHYPRAWLTQVLEDARPALIIAEADALGGLDAPAAQIIDPTHALRAAPAGWRAASMGVDEPACVSFTSGSTGRPKGVVNSQRNLLQRAAQSINAAHINHEDKFLTLASLCTIVGVRDVMTALLAGASIRLIDPQRVGAREILSVIHGEDITILFAFPALLRLLAERGGEQASAALRLVRVGGDTTLWSDIDLLRAWLAPQAAIQLIFAATEAPMMQWFVCSSLRGEDDRVPIGYPLAGNGLAVRAEDGRSAPPGEIGELIVRSRYVTVGRWVDGRCAPEPTDGAGARMFQTGDLVRQRPDGLLERIGRKDRQVKIRGARVDLDGVEAALRQHPFVSDVGALVRSDGADGRLVAYVKAREGAPDGLIEDLTQRMGAAAPHQRPARLYLTETIPRLPNSKLDVRALEALDEANLARREAAALNDGASSEADDHIARTLAQVWRATLNVDVAAPEDDFFEAGGDSLKAITMMIEIERALGVEVPVTLINEAPTFGALLQALRASRPPRDSPLVVLKAGADAPPVFIVHGVGGNVVELLTMARRMTYPGAVIGVQARGLADHEAPRTSVAAMASDYLSAITARQPKGPYFLCGYSFGGLVAFEMARQLSQSGAEIGLVGLFDTLMSLLRWPLRAWLSIASRRMARLMGGARAASMQPGDAPASGFLKSAPPSMIKVAASALMASALYRPGYYDGELTLFTPAGREPGLPTLESIWRPHARALALVETPGEHATMLSGPNAETFAALLTSRLPAR